MGLFDFFSGKNKKESAGESVIDEKAPVNQILSQPDDPFAVHKDVFKSENFKNASVQERMDAYQALENKLAQDEGRTPRKLVFDSEITDGMGFDEYGPEKYCGYYSSYDDKIHINPYYISDACANNGDQFDGMNTVAHEGRHAYHYDARQGYIEKTDKNYSENKSAIDKSYNENVYAEASADDPLTGTSKYYNIPCEQDTNAFAKGVLESDYFKETYGDDVNYQNHIASQNFAQRQMEDWAYRDDAINHLLEKNPEFAKQHETNLKNGENPQESLENLFGSKDNLNADIYRETQEMKAEHSPKEYAADYINAVSDKHNNIEPTPTMAQYNTHIMDDKNPEPENYSSVSDENRNGINNVSENINAAAQNRENALQSENTMRAHTGTDKALTDSGDYKYSVETVPASSVDTSTAMGMDNPNFWNHHGNDKESYMQLAEKLPQVQSEFDNGKTYDEIRNNPELHDCVTAYYAPDKMICAEEKDGKYEFVDDGRHRLAAAQELGYDVPVQNVSKPCMENTNSDFNRQNEQSEINGSDYSAKQDVQANNILAAREISQNPEQSYNYVDSDGYEPAKVLGGSGNNFESKQAQTEQDYYESCANPPASNTQSDPENIKAPQNDNGDEKSNYLSEYENSQALDNSNHYDDSENENNGSEIESEPDKLTAQEQAGNCEPSQEQEQPETLDTENHVEQSNGQKPSQEQEQPKALDTENSTEQSNGQKPSQEQEQPEALDTENSTEQSNGQKPSQEQEQPEALDTENSTEQSNGQKPSQEQEQPEALDTENSTEQSNGQKPSQEQEQPEALDTENSTEQSNGQKPSQEQEQPETLDTENGTEQSNGQKLSQENTQDNAQAGGNDSASDSASDNSSSKSNETDNSNSNDNSHDNENVAAQTAENAPEQASGMSM